jgi:hypothetical protein
MTKNYTMNTGIVAVLLAITILFPINGSTQSQNALVGAWKLISAIDVTDKGQVIKNPYGLNPTGFLTYTAEGRMMAVITNGGRKPLSVPTRYRLQPRKERRRSPRRLLMVDGTLSVATR